MLGEEEYYMGFHVDGSEVCKLYEFWNWSGVCSPQSEFVECSTKGEIYTLIYLHMKFYVSNLNDS